MLVVTPNTKVRDEVTRKLERQGPVHTAHGGAEALAKLESGQWQTLFLEGKLPDLDTEEFVGIVERRFPGVRLVMVDSIAENVPQEPRRVVEFSARTPRGYEDGPAFEHAEQLPGIVGDTQPMREVARMVRLVARRNTTVLITGPTGSGKDLVAQSIHSLSPRAGHNFSVLNCAAIPESLIESELFGYSRGAFTGASQNYSGRILAAQGGTLFLDEIGDLPLAAQSKLLRFLEKKEVQRLGSAETIRVDVRVVAATHRQLEDEVERGTFREDLYFRLSAFPIRLTPLKERGADMVALAAFFLANLAENGAPLKLHPKAKEKLDAHNWPGNVREMQQVLERAVILAQGRALISAEDIVFNGRNKA